MPTTKFLLMDASIAAELRQATLGGAHRLEPVAIEHGTYAGSFVLPMAVMDAPDFEEHLASLLALSTVDLDVGEIWPTPPEGEPEVSADETQGPAGG